MKNGMIEFTFIEPEMYLEFMVDFNQKTGKVIDCYTYKKDLEEEKDNWRLEYEGIDKIRWKAGNNSLFVHNKNAFKKIASCSVVIPQNEEEWIFLHRVMEVNNIENYEILEHD